MREPVADRTESPDLGENLKRLRRNRGWNLSRLAKEAELPQSTLSKVEAGQMSLNYEKLLRISQALDADVRELFATASEAALADGALARRTIDRASRRFKSFENLRIQHLSAELKQRLMIPVLMEVADQDGDPPMMEVVGERFAYVVEGPLEFHCAQYETVTLETGDSIYVDASMPHAFVAAKGTTARVITVLTSTNSEYLAIARDTASRGGFDASQRYLHRKEKRRENKMERG